MVSVAYTLRNAFLLQYFLIKGKRSFAKTISLSYNNHG